jgi:hypothetical protein
VAIGLDAALGLQLGAIRPEGGRPDWDGGAGTPTGLEQRPASGPALGAAAAQPSCGWRRRANARGWTGGSRGLIIFS